MINLELGGYKTHQDGTLDTSSCRYSQCYRVPLSSNDLKLEVMKENWVKAFLDQLLWLDSSKLARVASFCHLITVYQW